MNENDVTPPVFFEDSIEEAEKNCFNCLTSVLGYVAGKNAFIESNQGISDCIVFDIGHMTHPATACFPSRTYCYESYLEIYDRKRSKLQKMIMKLLGVFPSGGHHTQNELLKGSNIVLLRLSGSQNPFSNIEPSVFENEGRKVVTRKIRATFDVVFTTGARTSVQ